MLFPAQSLDLWPVADSQHLPQIIANRQGDKVPFISPVRLLPRAHALVTRHSEIEARSRGPHACRADQAPPNPIHRLVGALHAGALDSARSSVRRGEQRKTLIWSSLSRRLADHILPGTGANPPESSQKGKDLE